MAANTMLPVLLLTALKDHFLVCPGPGTPQPKTKNIPHLPNPLTLSTPTHNSQQHTLMQTKTNECLLQNIYFQLEDVEGVKFLVKMLPLL
jgi:hypothetical protein